MKYSFCYSMKKIITKDGEKLILNENDIQIENDAESEIIIKCGPWRDTLEEAKKDEDLFKKNPEEFFKTLQEKKD